MSKILFINAVCGIGSTGRIVVDLMKQAQTEGHTVKIACSTVEPIKGVQPNDVIIVGSKVDYYAHNMLSRLTDHEGEFSRGATKAFLKEVKKFNPDIVHIHNIHGHWINYELLFNYLVNENKRVIWTLHDCWPFTGHCTYFSMIGCKQWMTRCNSCKGLNGYPMCYGKGDVSYNFDRKKEIFNRLGNMIIVTPSTWLANLVKQSYLNRYKTIVIHNKIDFEVFKPTESDFREKHSILDKKIILGVSNVWNKEKGYYDFIKLPSLLNDSFVFVMVGLTADQMKMLPNRIIGIQRTHDTKELAQLYSAADVFVNLTYQDNYPTVNLEAIACGTPVVAYDSGGNCEAFNQTSGITVEQGDLQGVAEAINKAILFDRKSVLERSIEFKRYGDYRDLYKGHCI